MKRLKTQDAGRTTRSEAESRYSGQDTRRTSGSAIILAIVLTSLLAIIGVMFLLSSRVESVATSAISENKELTLAVDTVVARISEDLVYDVSRGSIDPNQYADYPDPCNPFLASLEPYQFGSNYFWRQISDIYGNILYTISHDMIAEDLPDYNNTSLFGAGTPADADGDGISDSMWVVDPNMTSSKGKSIFAAIRVIDNGGMLNINTAKIFNPSSSFGSSQMDVNLAALSQRGGNGLPATAASKLDDWRRGTELSILYEPNVIWQYGNPAGAFTPFDISDELVLRNRYILNNDQMTTRIENLWADSFKGGLGIPITSPSEIDSYPRFWGHRAIYDFSDPGIYDYRHIATTYNYDRIIAPDGSKMFNINLAASADANVDVVYDAVRASLAPSISDATAAQIAANLKDYVDDDPNVTVVYESNGVPHYGFEQPCIYISELVQSFVRPLSGAVTHSYAIELYKPYATDPIPDSNWRLEISDPYSTIPVTWSGNRPYLVLWKIDVNTPLDINLVDSNVVDDLNVVFNGNAVISLQRIVGGLPLTVDMVQVPKIDPATGWLVEPNAGDFNVAEHSIQRDITPNKCIRRLWENPLEGFLMPSSLGSPNPFVSPDTATIQAHPANWPFTNIGEFGQLFYNRAYQYYYGGVLFEMPPEGVIEPQMRINLALPAYQQVFRYLTVMDPNEPRYGGHPYYEKRIKGRININTAPWFVIAQLPWISYHTPNWDLARSIVNYREKFGPFKNIGELMWVSDTGDFNSIDYYARPGKVLPPLLLTPTDGAGDKFEERDAIFARISNLVTVRSDVFTAYILVRIGTDGPQKRAIAILDRSEVPAKKVKIVAIQMVPDPK